MGAPAKGLRGPTLVSDANGHKSENADCACPSATASGVIVGPNCGAPRPQTHRAPDEVSSNPSAPAVKARVRNLRLLPGWPSQQNGILAGSHAAWEDAETVGMGLVPHLYYEVCMDLYV